MALVCLRRLAATLGPGTVVTALLTDALRAIKTERQLKVSVSQSAAKETRAMLARWQQEHPHVEVTVLVNRQLEPFDCEIESELGRIELGLRKQLQAASEELSLGRPVPVTMPAADSDRLSDQAT